MCSLHTLDPHKKYHSSLLSDGKPCLDSLVLNFLQNTNKLITVGVFTRSRRAVLMNWKVRIILYNFLLSILYLILFLLAVISYDLENWNLINNK